MVKHPWGPKYKEWEEQFNIPNPLEPRDDTPVSKIENKKMTNDLQFQAMKNDYEDDEVILNVLKTNPEKFMDFDRTWNA